jgi:hypothetical protein
MLLGDNTTTPQPSKAVSAVNLVKFLNCHDYLVTENTPQTFPNTQWHFHMPAVRILK